MSHRSVLRLLPALLVVLACARGRSDADSASAADSAAAAQSLAPGDTGGAPGAPLDSSGAAAAPAPGGDRGDARAAGTKTGAAPRTGPATTGGIAAPAPGGISAVGGAGAAPGGVRAMPWENLAPVALEDLRSLVSLQQRAVAATGSYSSGITVPSREGWNVRVEFADARGWTAVARHGLYPGRSCVVWGGTSAAAAKAERTAAAGLRGAEGDPVCDPAPTR